MGDYNKELKGIYIGLDKFIVGTNSKLRKGDEVSYLSMDHIKSILRNESGIANLSIKGKDGATFLVSNIDLIPLNHHTTRENEIKDGYTLTKGDWLLLDNKKLCRFYNLEDDIVGIEIGSMLDYVDIVRVQSYSPNFLERLAFIIFS